MYMSDHDTHQSFYPLYSTCVVLGVVVIAVCVLWVVVAGALNVAVGSVVARLLWLTVCSRSNNRFALNCGFFLNN